MSTIAISDTAASEYAVEISQDAAGNQIVKRYTATELRNMNARKLALDEQETVFTIEATNRAVVRVYTADAYFQRRLERVGATLVRDCIDGGQFWEMPLNQLRITMPPRKLSDAQKEAAARHLESVRGT